MKGRYDGDDKTKSIMVLAATNGADIDHQVYYERLIDISATYG